MRPIHETTADAGTSRWLVVIAAAALLGMGTRSPATATSPEFCPEFHRECTEAQAVGYQDVGICHVEQLECPPDEDAHHPKPKNQTHEENDRDPDASVGERTIGP